ncbi:MAG: tRNA (5-methylaminomethyl-2-thiouridine)(34)-methyltransferase MnmD [Bacteroidales bacterium]
MLKIISTSDGSDTVYIPSLNEHYHSVNGAIQESKHVFIEAGYNKTALNPLKVLELGFGTGLNTLLTLKESLKDGRHVEYITAEKFPLPENILKSLNYSRFFPAGQRSFFKLIHDCEWENTCMISNNFSLLKLKKDFRDIKLNTSVDLVYFDAFAPERQPELWTFDVLSPVCSLINKGGVFVTYSARGQLKRDLTRLGFDVEHLPGPPGKRHITRAVKTG